MKKRLFPLLLLCMGLCSPRLYAQSVEKAEASYLQFNRLRTEGAGEPEIYKALYQSYQEYIAVVSTAASDTPAYAQSKRALREMWPYLQIGAAYHSSHGNQANALLLAQAYMDIPLLAAFRGEHFVQDDNFPTMAYFAASGTYNARDYAKAIDYFLIYLDTGVKKNRKAVYAGLRNAYKAVGNHDLEMEVIDKATTEFPEDSQLLSMGINSCIDQKDYVHLQKFLDKGLARNPNDEAMLNNQGLLYERTGEYQKALGTYKKLQQMKPNNLNVHRHIALNYYNLGVSFYHKASMENNEASAKKYSRQSKDYFSAAATTLNNVVANAPTDTKYVQALAVAYSCMGDAGQLEATNSKLSNLGAQTVETGIVPEFLAFEGNAVSRKNETVNHSSGSIAQNSHIASASGEVPPYPAWAKNYIEERLRKWQAKDEYETLSEYQQRVTAKTQQAKVEELQEQAMNDYIKAYTKNIRFNDLVLDEYDAEHNAFLVKSKYGQLVVPVPRANNEARVFESSWSGMQFKEPEYYIDGNTNQLALSGLTFITPTGKSYRYDRDKNLTYTKTTVQIDLPPIGVGTITPQPSGSSNVVNEQIIRPNLAKSDVDVDIPELKGKNEKTFAVIISNENYSMVTKVPMALNDGATFAAYCQKTLGIPKENVRHYPDATFGVMVRAIRDIRQVAEAFDGDLQVVFYYAGHGIPNEATKDAYLLPVDADGLQTEGCYSLNRLYTELGKLNARSVVVFLDACFSGAKRDGGMLASARGVALKAKAEAPQGNMVIFSAASGDETAFPYEEKGHGLFTYFLLKKLQESKGNVTLEELGSYIQQNVKRQSVVVNRKSQTPTVTPSTSVSDSWKRLRLRP